MNDRREGHFETLIVGGGVSGLACARRLHERRRDFVLVTDRLGGRMHHSPDGRMNFGATYVNEDYRHVGRYVRRGVRFRLREAFCQGNGTMTTLLDWGNVRFADYAFALKVSRYVRSLARDQIGEQPLE